MAMEPEELEEIPPQGHVKIVYTGSVAPHWEIHRVNTGDAVMVLVSFSTNLHDPMGSDTLREQILQP